MHLVPAVPEDVFVVEALDFRWAPVDPAGATARFVREARVELDGRRIDPHARRDPFVTDDGGSKVHARREYLRVATWAQGLLV